MAEQSSVNRDKALPPSVEYLPAPMVMRSRSTFIAVSSDRDKHLWQVLEHPVFLIRVNLSLDWARQFQLPLLYP